MVASIWGRTVGEYARAASALAGVPLDDVVAVEINLSCPNLEGGRHLFAHSPEDTAAVVAAAASCQRPRWAKLTAATHRLVAVARAAAHAGAEAVTLINTVPGLVLDLEARCPALGAGGGGLSGPAIHPLAVRAVFDVHAELPDLAIVGVGGVANGLDGIELMLAGATAVQVGTATFADPRAPSRVLAELTDWCRTHGVTRAADIRGAAHRREHPLPVRQPIQRVPGWGWRSTSTTWSPPHASPAVWRPGSARPRWASSSSARPARNRSGPCRTWVTRSSWT